MGGTAQDPTVPKTRGRLVVERVFIMLVGLFIGIPLAFGASWASDGAISFWQAMVPVAIAVVAVPPWTIWSTRRAARR